MMRLVYVVFCIGLVHSESNDTETTTLSSLSSSSKLFKSTVFENLISLSSISNDTEGITTEGSDNASTTPPMTTTSTATATSTIKSTISDRGRNRPAWMGKMSTGRNSSLTREEKLEMERRMERHRQMKLAKEIAREEKRKEVALKRAHLEKEAREAMKGKDSKKKKIKAKKLQKTGKMLKREKAKNEKRLATKVKEERERTRIESLKKQIVGKLRLGDSAPLRSPAVPLQFLQRHILGDESDDDDSDDRAKTTDIMVFGQDITRRCRHRKSTGCFKFNLRNKIEGRVLSAELFVYKLRDHNDGQQSILLSELERPKFKKLLPKNLVSRLDTDIGEGWLKFRLDKAAQKWAEKPLTNDGISLKCKTCARQGHKQLYSAKEGYRPVLIVHIDPTSHHRAKRNVDCGGTVTGCCKYHFWVNFKDINLPQILFPTGIWANYCTGSCRVNDNLGTFNHTNLLHDFRSNSESANDTIREAVVPCCGAVRLKTMSLLYANEEGDVVRSHVPDLAVEKCGCL